MNAAGVTLAGVPSIDWVALSPVLGPVAGLVVILLIDAVVPGGHRLRWLMDLAGLASLAGSAVALVFLARDGGERATACVTGSSTLAPQCSYLASDLTFVLQGVV